MKRTMRNIKYKVVAVKINEAKELPDELKKFLTFLRENDKHEAVIICKDGDEIPVPKDMLSEIPYFKKLFGFDKEFLDSEGSDIIKIYFEDQSLETVAVYIFPYFHKVKRDLLECILTRKNIKGRHIEWGKHNYNKKGVVGSFVYGQADSVEDILHIPIKSSEGEDVTFDYYPHRACKKPRTKSHTIYIGLRNDYILTPEGDKLGLLDKSIRVIFGRKMVIPEDPSTILELVYMADRYSGPKEQLNAYMKALMNIYENLSREEALLLLDFSERLSYKPQEQLRIFVAGRLGEHKTAHDFGVAFARRAMESDETKNAIATITELLCLLGKRLETTVAVDQKKSHVFRGLSCIAIGAGKEFAIHNHETGVVEIVSKLLERLNSKTIVPDFFYKRSSHFVRYKSIFVGIGEIAEALATTNPKQSAPIVKALIVKWGQFLKASNKGERAIIDVEPMGKRVERSPLGKKIVEILHTLVRIHGAGYLENMGQSFMKKNKVREAGLIGHVLKKKGHKDAADKIFQWEFEKGLEVIGKRRVNRGKLIERILDYNGYIEKVVLLCKKFIDRIDQISDAEKNADRQGVFSFFGYPRDTGEEYVEVHPDAALAIATKFMTKDHKDAKDFAKDIAMNFMFNGDYERATKIADLFPEKSKDAKKLKKFIKFEKRSDKSCVIQ